mmetsp:Transcript_110140/g.322252  ORF Transcript_110140/g.322252 Transcript_110140/m.322252 type:complete len:232 (-) Transcript_110140:959-1654(-)
MSWEKPVSTSSARRGRDLASPFPKHAVSTPNSSSIVARICACTAPPLLSPSAPSSPRSDCWAAGEAAAAAPRLWRPCFSSLSGVHHSKVRLFSALSSCRVKDILARVCGGVTSPESSVPTLMLLRSWPPSFPGLLLASLPTSSNLRSATAGSGSSVCKTSRPTGATDSTASDSSSDASCGRGRASQGWARAPCAERRRPSCLRSSCLMKSAKVGDTTLRKTGSLCFTSHSV